MLSQPIKEMLQRLRKGTYEKADTDLLERSPASDVVTELRSVYRVSFLEHQHRHKKEFALAKVLRAVYVLEGAGDEDRFVPVYVGCLMISIEDDRITGLSWLSRISLEDTDAMIATLALTTGPGVKLQKLPDGWEIKPMRKRTVELTRDYLRGRGWRLDHLKQLIRRA